MIGSQSGVCESVFQFDSSIYTNSNCIENDTKKKLLWLCPLKQSNSYGEIKRPVKAASHVSDGFLSFNSPLGEIKTVAMENASPS